MVGTRRLSSLLESAVSRLELPDGPLVVALSGGADSATLALFCRHLEREVRAVHIDHGLTHSSMMESAARAVAADLDIDLDVRAVVVPDGPSPEGQARRARYAELARATSGDEGVITAHTRDDQVETVLFNLIRGTGSRGLAGIPYFRAPNIFRPALAVTRSETRETAALAGLSYADDPMNDDPSLARNMVRTRVIPIMSELNPRLPDSVARAARAIGDDDRYLEDWAATVPMRGAGQEVAVAVGDLMTTPPPVRDRVLKSLITRVLGAGAVTGERVRALAEIAEGRRGPLQMGPHATASINGPMLVIRAPEVVSDSAETSLLPGHHRVGRLEFDVVAGDGPCRVLPLSRWSAVFPAGVDLTASVDGVVLADGVEAWVPGVRRHPVAWYQPGQVGYLALSANEVTGWTSGH